MQQNRLDDVRRVEHRPAISGAGCEEISLDADIRHSLQPTRSLRSHISRDATSRPGFVFDVVTAGLKACTTTAKICGLPAVVVQTLRLKPGTTTAKICGLPAVVVQTSRPVACT